MVCCMKTTVDLPDDLLIEAKKHAAETRRPLRELVAAGLRSVLGGGAGPASKGKIRKIRWVTVSGELPAVNVADREQMHEWITRQR